MSTDQIDYDTFDFEEPPQDGKIVTFYSFKGGVGRTMALANTAFLAACHGKKVLVMDWDLEAPGLAYYFRGVQEPSIARELRTSPGVLNFLWDWTTQVQGESKAAIEQVTAEFESGRPFNNCVRELVDPGFFAESDGSIDYIGAGSPKISTPLETNYEEALARFPWHDFFTKLAGGYVPFALRNWAKKNYDLILIDSRTGLAESAGVCTMQLPDAVALCFVLNRQNIEGISKIASVIRQQKPDTTLFATPMRVAREGTSEESEARAKAITDLMHVGGFTAELIQQQMQSLAIKHADNVPFYESLAPIVAEDPEVDPICLNYLRFAREVTGEPDMGIARLDPQMVNRARARLQPQLATSEYVEKLLGSEPLRAITELQSLISSAEELVVNGGHEALSDSYLRILTAAAFEPRSMQFPDRSNEVRRQALSILRMLYEANSGWNTALIDALEAHLVLGNLEEEDELGLREELDTLYAQIQGLATALKRLDNRRHLARLFSELHEYEVANQTAAEIIALISELRKSSGIGEETLSDISFFEADTLFLRGNIALALKDFAAAKNYWEEAIREYPEMEWESVRQDLKRTISDVHAVLAVRQELGSSLPERQRHALAAAHIAGGSVSMQYLMDLVATLSHSETSSLLLQFLELTLGTSASQSRIPLSAYWGRSHLAADRLLHTFTTAIISLEPHYGKSELTPILQRMSTIVDATIVQIGRRRIVFGNRRPVNLAQKWEEFVNTLQLAGVRAQPSEEVLNAIGNISRDHSRFSSVKQ